MATRFMYKTIAAAALGIALSFLLTAPTTASSASSNAPAAPSNCTANLFAGSWSGTYVGAAGTLYGTIDLTISDAGLITGTFHNDVFNFDGTVSGHVNADGRLVIIFRLPDLGASVYPFLGTAVIVGNGNLVASYANAWPPSQGGFTEVAILERN